MSTIELALLGALNGLLAALLIRQARRFRAPAWHIAMTASAVFFLAGLVWLWQAVRASLGQ